MTAWDRLLFGRAALLSSMLLAAGACVMVATDEPTSGVSDRLARAAAMAPVLSALAAALLATALARRGEARALVAIGARPLRLHAGLVVGAASIGLALAASIAAGMGSLRALFPRLAAPPWSATPEGFSAAGVALTRAGDISFTSRAELATVALPRGMVAVTLLVAAVTFPVWAVLPSARAPPHRALGARRARRDRAVSRRRRRGSRGLAAGVARGPAGSRGVLARVSPAVELAFST